MTDISLFDYNLPKRLIAQRPAARRDESRLMIVDRKTGAIVDSVFGSFPDSLSEGDVLVVNTTKVFPARLVARRDSGGKVEILLVRRLGPGEWEAMARGLKKISPGEKLTVGDGLVELIEKLPGGAAVFGFGSDEQADQITLRFGQTPLPPYITRPGGAADENDRLRYQTVFAKTPGSCAAPTAGLHFTKETLESIRARGVVVVPVVLHVGPGTFRPVKSKNIEDHEMDAEFYEIPEKTAEAINTARAEGRAVVAVGSTVTRALESSAGGGFVRPGTGSTRLYITPGFDFKIVDALLTNFHLPKSTLLILVSAFAGRDLIMKAYREAVKKEYRFFSYGDAMFIR